MLGCVVVVVAPPELVPAVFVEPPALLLELWVALVFATEPNVRLAACTVEVSVKPVMSTG
jgi:hypothetical protein